MPHPTLLTSDAKEALRKTVRGLRGRLIEKLSEAARGEYRLDVAIEKAKLPEARRCRRERLEAWIDEESRAAAKGSKSAAKDLRPRFLQQAVKEAAHTLLNRLVFLRILEHHEVLAPAVLTGGWKSPAYENEFVHYAGPLGKDDTLGYRDLLQVVFDELAIELPGLFGPVGLTPLFPIPAAALREVVEALNDSALDTAWGDDTTFGWVYQYWNDPEREELDKKIANRGKIEPHEIASKTQMFTERYMVEWLLENSLGLSWLCICKKNGWTADAEAVLPVLDARRADWRKKREAGEVALDALMPIAPGLENAWKYYVPQPIPSDAVDKAPASIADVKLLDPACGSGHFLVIAFDRLAEMYAEEARHRGEAWAPADIAARILANNLHGIDIDPRATQIAAASLWLKAKLYAPDATLARMNLVAPRFRLAALPKDDPALGVLFTELESLGVPRTTTQKLVDSLAGVDHLGTLLRVDRAIAELLDDTEKEDGPLFGHAAKKQRAALESRVAEFLDAHASEADLGLRLEGEQLAAGLRFVRMVKEGSYDVVVGNPPYQGISKTAQFDYVVRNYPRGKADLYAAFLERGLELVREGGCSAFITIRGWMFLGQFQDLRRGILAEHRLVLGDLGWGAFELMTDNPVTMSIAQRGIRSARSLSICPANPTARVRTDEHRRSLATGLLAQVGRYEFDPKGFEVIEGEPIVYWWTAADIEVFQSHALLGRTFPVASGVKTGDDVRFVRSSFEVESPSLSKNRAVDATAPWQFYIKGAAGAEWIEPATQILRWAHSGLQLKVFGTEVSPGTVRLRDPAMYFRLGIAFSPIGASFSARAHRFPSIFGNMGSSVFAPAVPSTLCTMNTSRARRVLQSLNPGIHFENDDVKRLPLFPVRAAVAIYDQAERAFSEHESHREPSVEFQRPGPSPWRYAQDWAQRAVDRPEGTPLPEYTPEYDLPAPEAFVSFAIGVALGRFGANGEGILDAAPADTLPHGILFVGPADALPDSLAHAASARIAAAWDEHGAAITKDKKQPLRDWLRDSKGFFAHHKALYVNRPIYFPLSSEKRSFVAWVSIHRWADNTLQTLLADHLHPVLRQLDGQITDLNASRASSDKKIAAAAEKQFATVKRHRDEMAAFIAAVSQCAERGAPPTDAACPPREVDAPFRMDLDDGVMINSAALWPLLAPQWGDPKKWWKQLSSADGKDYDWAHLAKRYFPTRVDAKCQVDPSLAVAHGCFWKYHPAKAYQWELRLKDEIRPDFTIDEAGSDETRERFLREHAAEAEALVQKEMVRRERARARKGEGAEAADEGETEEGAEGDGEEEVA